MAHNVEIARLAEFHIDLKDILLLEHQVLVPLVAADRHSKVSLAPEVRIIAQLLFEADL